MRGGRRLLLSIRALFLLMGGRFHNRLLQWLSAILRVAPARRIFHDRNNKILCCEFATRL
jgi:hypothetical protein